MYVGIPPLNTTPDLCDDSFDVHLSTMYLQQSQYLYGLKTGHSAPMTVSKTTYTTYKCTK